MHQQEEYSMETRQECEQRHGGWIYAAREGKTPLVKIGVTACVEARMKTLRSQFGCPFTLLGAVQVTYRYPWTVEFKVHRLLRAQHIEREWFYLHMDQQWLESLVRQAKGTCGVVGLDGERLYQRRRVLGLTYGGRLAHRLGSYQRTYSAWNEGISMKCIGIR
jgi:T5orf172 domain